MAVERRLTEIVGPVGGKLHTARSRNDQVATDMAMFTRAHALRAIEALHRPADRDRAGRRGAPGLGDAGLHAPAARAAGLSESTTCWRTSGCSGATRRALRSVLGSTAELPLGSGALAGVNFPTDRRLVAGGARVRGRRRRTRSTASPTATSCSTSSRPPRPAPRTCRGWARRSCCGPRRSSASPRCATTGPPARRSCRRRRTRTRPSCCARRRRGSWLTSPALHGVMHGLPLTYNKDMQEDKEHLFDTVDTLELCLAAARGMLGAITFKRERLAGAATDEMLAAVDVADMLVKRGVPFRQSHGIVAGPGPHGGRVGPRALAALRARSSPSTPTSSTTTSTRCYPKGRGSSPRRARAGRRWRGCASSSPTREASLDSTS